MFERIKNNHFWIIFGLMLRMAFNSRSIFNLCQVNFGLIWEFYFSGQKEVYYPPPVTEKPFQKGI
jgi:hypothetical protein